MKKTQELIPLFKQFIRDSENGKRLKKNGERIKASSVESYRWVLQNLVQFSTENSFELRICSILKMNARELKSEKNYWKKFYTNFTEFMYKKGCYDNYVGNNIKIIRVFFNWLKEEKDIYTGDFHKKFYVRKEQVDILVLSPEQLKFLIHDKEFEKQLTASQLKLKDIFVFGCTTGLRFSDMFALTSKNFEKTNDEWYLKLKSQKTKTYSFIKLPTYASAIYLKYKPTKANLPVFGEKWLSNFNRSLKRIGEMAGWTANVEISREKQGKAKKVPAKKGKERFCDNMSSHMMRRTAITTMLILGMPELLVRKISGHSHNSASFHRYVHYAQVYLDREIEKVHQKLENY
ncbi:tyrosine-type recombinase/integrase [Flavobacterium oreochromis]|uniref:tyrosine-type recombinase/integrase n=1 Tax=Flavobacterium oreochromis TaxID=2906078 RepID=UPI003859244C